MDAILAAGRDVLFDIDWQGTQQLAEIARQDLASVFILPPSTAELERRLRNRGQDAEDVVRHRMDKAAEEMQHYFEYRYIVINRDIEESVRCVQAILTAERQRRERLRGLHDFVESLRSG